MESLDIQKKQRPDWEQLIKPIKVRYHEGDKVSEVYIHFKAKNCKTSAEDNKITGYDGNLITCKIGPQLFTFFGYKEFMIPEDVFKDKTVKCKIDGQYLMWEPVSLEKSGKII